MVTRLGQLQRNQWWIEERGFQEASCMSDLPILRDLLQCCPRAKAPDGARCGRESLQDEQEQERRERRVDIPDKVAPAL
jgi:hypothetical protein